MRASQQRGPPGSEGFPNNVSRPPNHEYLQGLLKASKAYVSLFYEGPRIWGCWTNF